MDKPLIAIYQLKNVQNPRIPGYFVLSTAPINVEGDKLASRRQNNLAQQQQNLQQLADLIYQKVITEIHKPADFIELVISIHGFSNSRPKSIKRFAEIHEYVNSDNSRQFVEKANKLIYVGYRWSSESLTDGNFKDLFGKIYTAVTALPSLAKTIFFVGFLGIIFLYLPQLRELFFASRLGIIFSLVILLLMLGFFAIITLFLMRLSGYFRDRYRADNFGVPDLVEFIRQLDKLLMSKAKENYLDEVSLIPKVTKLLMSQVKEYLYAVENLAIADSLLEIISNKVIKDYCLESTVKNTTVESLLLTNNFNLSRSELETIINVANKILIQETNSELADLRDGTREILENKAKRFWRENNRIKLSFIGHSMGGEVVTNVVRILSDIFDLRSVGNLGTGDKLPSADIGKVFRLGRLVLVAPDIPINTIISGRANFLASSLRRFEETYLFSNEADIALRLASTVANYFSFPARTRTSGYRLGNLGIRNSLPYGIVNLEQVSQENNSKFSFNNLFIDSFNIRKSLENFQVKYFSNLGNGGENIAELFTFFDCTNYQDYTLKSSHKTQQILSFKKWFWEPKLVYYLRLIIANGLEKCDPHSGFFAGEFSRQAIYRLAFLGFGSFLDSLSVKPINELINEVNLAEIDTKLKDCEKKCLALQKKGSLAVQTELIYWQKELAKLEAQLTKIKQEKQEFRQAALTELNQISCQKKIQIILGQERYQVDVLGLEWEQVRRKMLTSN
ncbi:MAG: alpha/beta hydrolase [Oscillatoria sp. PMC 1051.18]|nr:alpha/beta hydrolase [Oscillatoria sp. PMC 1050.18]MEC5031552.1 alpha/beta hydrolase [Oscillatoria sp. PMC 1051.18]